MKPCEAARQYQVALEHERKLRSQLDGIMSAHEELQAAVDETKRALEQMNSIRFDREFGRITAGMIG